MDCLDAQRLLSESSDGELVDVTRLAEANLHCADCSDCTAFARGLMALRAMHAPKAPETLLASIHTAVLREAARKPQPSPEPVAEPGDAVIAETAPEASEREIAPPAPKKRPDSWRSPWAWGMAAAILIGFGMLTQYGIGLMTNSFDRANDSLAGSETYAPQVSDGTALQASPPAEDTAEADKAQRATSEAPSFVVKDGHVFRAQGARETSGTPLAVAGSVRTALDGGGGPTLATVYADPAQPNGFLLQNAEGTYMAFAPVTRVLGGRTYSLTSDRDIERFGEWPALPATYSEPATADGSPIFFEWGVDDSGAKVFAPRGRGVDAGFAVAPGTSASDPAAGNPNWTWWEPL